MKSTFSGSTVSIKQILDDRKKNGRQFEERQAAAIYI